MSNKPMGIQSAIENGILEENKLSEWNQWLTVPSPIGNKQLNKNLADEGGGGGGERKTKKKNKSEKCKRKIKFSLLPERFALPNTDVLI